ncbi:unnamed protein product, partial [marine sediment metagenome]
PDQAIESPFVACSGFAAFQVQFGYTAKAAWRVMRGPLGGYTEKGVLELNDFIPN